MSDKRMGIITGKTPEDTTGNEQVSLWESDGIVMGACFYTSGWAADQVYANHKYLERYRHSTTNTCDGGVCLR